MTIIGIIILTMTIFLLFHWQTRTKYEDDHNTITTKDGVKYITEDGAKNNYITLRGKKCYSIVIYNQMPKGLYLNIKKETKIDKFFKNLGVSRELLQTGDERLDKDMYFSINNRNIIKMIKKSQNIQSLLINILDLYSNNFVSLSVNNGNLRLVISKFKGSASETVAISDSETIAILKEIIDEINKNLTESKETEDYYFFASCAINSIILGCFLYLIPSLLFGYQITEKQELFINSIYLSIVATLILAIITIKILNSSSFTHSTLLRVFSLGLISFIIIIYNFTIYINGDFDYSKSYLINGVVVKKSIGNRRAPPTIYIRDQTSKRFSIVISKDYYRKLKINDNICIEMKKGFFNYRWIKNYHTGYC